MYLSQKFSNEAVESYFQKAALMEAFPVLQQFKDQFLSANIESIFIETMNEDGLEGTCWGKYALVSHEGGVVEGNTKVEPIWLALAASMDMEHIQWFVHFKSSHLTLLKLDWQMLRVWEAEQRAEGRAWLKRYLLDFGHFC